MSLWLNFGKRRDAKPKIYHDELRCGRRLSVMFVRVARVSIKEGAENDDNEMGDAMDRSGSSGLCGDGGDCVHRLVLWL